MPRRKHQYLLDEACELIREALQGLEKSDKPARIQPAILQLVEATTKLAEARGLLCDSGSDRGQGAKAKPGDDKPVSRKPLIPARKRGKARGSAGD